jgi:hypothetical protein
MSKTQLFSKPWILLLALILVLPLAACKKGYVSNFLDLPVVAGSGSPARDKVKGVILSACIGRGWVAREVSPGLISATLTARSHTAQIEIPYTATKFSIIYKNSVNFSYDPQKQTIHNRYNRWVNNLRQDIQAGLARL